MRTDGLLAVHDNVMFEANAAERGGAVSLRSNSIVNSSADIYVLIGFARIDSISFPLYPKF